MAGRLIILRHKTWHVWNRENIEKVKKDERLHREEMERKRENERKLHSEQILEIFQQNNETETEGTQQTTRGLLSIDRSVENEEYKKEKEEKELLAKRREGSAPWALGEGSSELKKMKPWYLTKDKEKEQKKVIRIGGKILSGEQAEAAADRDHARKRSEDPMSMYLHTTNEREEKNENTAADQIVVFDSKKATHSMTLPGMSGLNPFVLGMRADDRPTTSTLKATSGEDKREHSKDKKRKHSKHEKKEKKKKQKKEKKRRRQSSEKEQEGEGSESGISSSSSVELEARHSQSVYHHSLSRDEVELLRQRRTERERSERLREGRLRETAENSLC
jgi:hypothetical protein